MSKLVNYLYDKPSKLMRDAGFKKAVTGATPEFKRKTGDFTLDSTDTGDMIEVDGAATVTVPLDTTVNFAIGTTITLIQYSSSQITVAPAAGVTLLTQGGGLRSLEQYAFITLIKAAANVWYVKGDTTV